MDSVNVHVNEYFSLSDQGVLFTHEHTNEHTMVCSLVCSSLINEVVISSFQHHKKSFCRAPTWNYRVNTQKAVVPHNYVFLVHQNKNYSLLVIPFLMC